MVDLTERDNTSELKTTFFLHDQRVSRSDLERAFKMMRELESGILKTKLANFYLLQSILLPRQVHKKINWKHWCIMDNEEELNEYPWGRLSYNLTYEFFKKATCVDKKGAVYLQGFPLVLVYWASEIIPKLSSLDVGFERKFYDNGPRITRWECLRPDEWGILKENIFDLLIW